MAMVTFPQDDRCECIIDIDSNKTSAHAQETDAGLSPVSSLLNHAANTLTTASDRQIGRLKDGDNRNSEPLNDPKNINRFKLIYCSRPNAMLPKRKAALHEIIPATVSVS
jgi:hypothetical protein